MQLKWSVLAVPSAPSEIFKLFLEEHNKTRQHQYQFKQFDFHLFKENGKKELLHMYNILYFYFSLSDKFLW